MTCQQRVGIEREKRGEMTEDTKNTFYGMALFLAVQQAMKEHTAVLIPI